MTSTLAGSTLHGVAASVAEAVEDFFENGAVALHIVGGDWTILRANNAELELLGYSVQEYISRHAAEFHADPPVIEDTFARLLRGETIRRYPARLSKIDRLFVVAHSSTQGYRDRAVDLGRVGREQGVRYVLEGTVRRAPDRVRVTAHLTDVGSGQQIWGERFDRGLDDFFAVQDELTREVAVNLQVQLTEGDQARVRAGGTNDLRAWELTMRGADLVNRHVRDDNLRAHGVLEEAVRIDPRYVDAWC